MFWLKNKKITFCCPLLTKAMNVQFDAGFIFCTSPAIVTTEKKHAFSVFQYVNMFCLRYDGLIPNASYVLKLNVPIYY